jgi:hypothetical protein
MLTLNMKKEPYSAIPGYGSDDLNTPVLAASLTDRDTQA